jgi:hypothetical protein
MLCLWVPWVVPKNGSDKGDSAKGDDRNRTGVDGFAGRCVATPPRRQDTCSVAACGPIWQSA